MKGKAILGVVLMTAWQSAQAEPVFIAQALSVLHAKQGDAGVGAEFGYQASEIENSPAQPIKIAFGCFRCSRATALRIQSR